MDLRVISAEELSRLCANTQDTEAWLEFIRRFQRAIALTILRISKAWGVNNLSVVDDLVQETYMRLCADHCKVLRTFSTQEESGDALVAYLRVIAANVAHDYFRSKTALKRGGSSSNIAQQFPDEDLLSDLNNGSLQLEREVQVREIERALERASEIEISVRERLIFRLYFRQGMAASAIAAIPMFQLSVKGVESAIHRVTQYLRLRLNPEPKKGKLPVELSEGEVRPFPMKREEA